MSGLMAVCTPNSHPHDDGRVEHGYQLNVLDEDLAVQATVDLPDWESFQQEAAGRRLTEAGFALDPTGADSWRPSGLGFMAPVVRTGPAEGAQPS
ncbi:hypothetical protein ACGFZZ_33700 [Streptomyces tendae]|uniref:hypothetical protein n=1 Tax=Streptomyces tendae TaxID=1932 RepID=UPI0037216FF5